MQSPLYARFLLAEGVQNQKIGQAAWEVCEIRQGGRPASLQLDMKIVDGVDSCDHLCHQIDDCCADAAFAAGVGEQANWGEEILCLASQCRQSAAECGGWNFKT